MVASKGRAQEEDCADIVDQVQYGQAIAAGAPPPEVTYFVLALHKKNWQYFLLCFIWLVLFGISELSYC